MDGSPSVLVLDDDAVTASRLAELLKDGLGCRTEWTQSALQALRWQRDRLFDLVITDLRMGHSDGLAVLAQLKALSPVCEVIVITSYPTIATAIEAVRIGAFDYISRNEATDLWLDPLFAKARLALGLRPSRRAPQLYREHLLHFLLSRTARPFLPCGSDYGALNPGLALELSVKLLLESCPGMETTWHQRHGAGEEHDLVCLNSVDHPFWRERGSLVLVECRDRSKKCEAKDRSWFEEKIRNRRGAASLGLFISTEGFTRGFLHPLSLAPVPGGAPPIVVAIDGPRLREWLLAENRLLWLTEHAIQAVF